MAGVAISVRDLAHGYETPRGRLTVLRGVTLDLPEGGYAAVTGTSGAGKTTFLAILGGLEQPESGSVHVGGQDVAQLSGDALADYRRATIGFVFQHFGLLDTLTAAENIELAFTLGGVPQNRRRARAAELLDAVGLSARARHRPAALSGGERQRVAIARAMANQPRLLLADEPTGNLDDDSAERVLELLEELRRDHGCTLMIVTHDRLLASRADHRFHLDKGSLAEPNVRGSLAEPNVRGSLAEPNVRGSLAEPNVRGSLAEPTVRGSLAEPTVRGSLAEPTVTSWPVDPVGEGAR